MVMPAVEVVKCRGRRGHVLRRAAPGVLQRDSDPDWLTRIDRAVVVAEGVVNRDALHVEVRRRERTRQCPDAWRLVRSRRLMTRERRSQSRDPQSRPRSTAR